MDALNRYPQYYAKKFFYEGGYILICDENNYFHPEGLEDSTNAYITFNHTVALSITIKDLGSKQTFLSMCHELGHYYDFSRGFISDTEKWCDIFEAYKYQYPQGYNSEEFFADQYQIYILNVYGLLKEGYQFESPKAQNYMREIVETDALWVF